MPPLSIPVTITYDSNAEWITTASTAWNTWATSSASATNAVNNLWSTWTTSATTTGGTLHYTIQQPPVSAERRAELRASMDAAQEIRREADLLRHERLQIAKARANETLRLLLDDRQWDSWQREDHFELLTPAGRRYRVRRGHAGNVRLIEQGAEVEALCCHPEMHQGTAERLPNEDAVIAQVLALRTDESAFRRTANITEIYPSSRAA